MKAIKGTFRKDWLTHLIKLAKPISRIFFMEDPSQSIYESDDNVLSREWPLIKSPVTLSVSPKYHSVN